MEKERVGQFINGKIDDVRPKWLKDAKSMGGRGASWRRHWCVLRLHRTAGLIVERISCNAQQHSIVECTLLVSALCLRGGCPPWACQSNWAAPAPPLPGLGEMCGGEGAKHKAESNVRLTRPCAFVTAMTNAKTEQKHVMKMVG